jgi:hypothetical protein
MKINVEMLVVELDDFKVSIDETARKAGDIHIITGAKLHFVSQEAALAWATRGAKISEAQGDLRREFTNSKGKRDVVGFKRACENLCGKTIELGVPSGRQAKVKIPISKQLATCLSELVVEYPGITISEAQEILETDATLPEYGQLRAKLAKKYKSK